MWLNVSLNPDTSGDEDKKQPNKKENTNNCAIRTVGSVVGINNPPD